MRKLILLLTATFLIACQGIREQKPTDKAGKILGTWVSNEGVYYSFSSDKTGEVGDHVEGEKILWWNIIEDSIFIVIELQPDTIRYKIKFQTERTLVFNNTFKFRKR